MLLCDANSVIDAHPFSRRDVESCNSCGLHRLNSASLSAKH